MELWEKRVETDNGNICLRRLEEGDTEALRDLFEYPLSINDARMFLKAAEVRYAQKKSFVLGIARKQLIGVIEAYHVKDGEAEIGYRIKPSFQNKGYATEAVGLFTDLLMNTYGLKELYAIVEKDNTASYKVLKKNKFQEESKEKSIRMVLKR